jgi:hypothetical protein
VDDYLVKYQTPEGFDLPRLLNDDFWLSIKLLFNAQHYASASKLLLSFIDSMAFIESGESSGRSFQSWLNRYAKLQDLNITPEELWEHRNALLHMTRLDSRRIEAGKVKRLIAYVGALPVAHPREDEDSKWFDLFALMQAIASACSRYISALNANPTQWREFANRYDLVVSDVRQLRIDGEPAG